MLFHRIIPLRQSLWTPFRLARIDADDLLGEAIARITPVADLPWLPQFKRLIEAMGQPKAHPSPCHSPLWRTAQAD